MTDDIRDLLARWRRGDETALAELVRRQMGWLHGYVRKHLGPHLRAHDESIDFVQHALVDLLSRDQTIRLDDEGGLRALLARIVDNDLKDRNRWLLREKRDPNREERAVTDSLLGDARHEITSPSGAAARRETAAWMRGALDQLPAADRQVIELREYERLSYQEIAERLGISTDAARVRFQRALPKLARLVSELRNDR